MTNGSRLESSQDLHNFARDRSSNLKLQANALITVLRRQLIIGYEVT